MKRRKLIRLAGSLGILLLTTGSLAGKPGATRIRFKRGDSSATVIGRLTSKKLRQSFLVGARAGQELSVQLKAQTSHGLDFANFVISDPSGKSISADDGGAARIQLTQTGDYRIEVTPPGSFYRGGNKNLRFSLSVKVE